MPPTCSIKGIDVARAISRERPQPGVALSRKDDERYRKPFRMSIRGVGTSP